MSDLTILQRCVEAYITAAETAAKPAKLAILQAHATALRAAFVPTPTERGSGKGPPRMPYTITIDGRGNVHCYGIAEVAKALNMKSAQSVANNLTKGKGIWRDSRYGLTGERDVTFTVVRELLGEHSEEAAAFLARTQAPRPGRPQKNSATTQIGKPGTDAERRAFVASKIAGGMSRTNAVFAWREHCGIDASNQ